MTTKELATMFSGLKIPVPEMEKMIKKHVQDELKKFRVRWNADGTWDRIIIEEKDIKSYLKKTK